MTAKPKDFLGDFKKKGSRKSGMRGLIYVRYRDHVLYHRSDPLTMAPQTRETVGWLVYECPDYLIVSWDKDAGPPTLTGNDSKASGLVILRDDILELRRVRDVV